MSAAKILKFVSVRLLLVGLVFALSTSAYAQGTVAEKPPTGGPRRQLGTIIYAGLGGAVLGLSTLSFYGRPQDKLANIAIGFAIGVIGGTVAVTYSAATNPDDFYGADSGVVRIEDRRVALLGPESSATVLEAKNADATAPAISFSHEVFSF